MPAAAGPPRILLGTASWTDRPLIEAGTFYPQSVHSAEARLRYYASRFPLVEVDATYYGLPQVDVARRWVERTPRGFTFDVKAYSLFTDHPTPQDRLPRAIRDHLPAELHGKERFYRRDAPRGFIDLCWSTFNDALLPLHDTGRLGLIVFQFPRWFVPGPHSHDYLEEIRDRLGHYRGAIEFRNEQWMDGSHREQTLSLLGDLDLTYICVDEPQGFESSVPPVAAATTRRALVRFHGRNARMWEAHTGTASERFDHYYTPAELDEWVPRIAELARHTDEVQLILNTNNFDQGPVNALLLAERLTEAGLPPTPWAPDPAADPPPGGVQGLLW